MQEMRYTLAPGTQVREEEFGLLFYTMTGPRLYFLSSGDLLGCGFFEGKWTLGQWIEQHCDPNAVTRARITALEKNLNHLQDKGVLVER